MSGVIPLYIPENVERTDFDPEEFRDAVLSKGLDALWEMALPCPCEKKMVRAGESIDTGEPVRRCALCDGSGWAYCNPQPTRMLLYTTVDRKRAYAPYTQDAYGTVYATFLPEHLPSFNDRYTLLQDARVYTDRRIRRATVESLEWPIVQHIFPSGSECDASNRQMWKGGVTACYRAGLDGLVDTTQNLENEDFTITDAGQIDHTLGIANGRAPVLGARYTTRYFGRPRFTCQDHPFVRRGLSRVNEAGEEVFDFLPVASRLVAVSVRTTPPLVQPLTANPDQE